VGGGAARHAWRVTMAAPPTVVAAARPSCAGPAGPRGEEPAQRPDALSAYQAPPRPDPLGNLEATAWAGDPPAHAESDVRPADVAPAATAAAPDDAAAGEPAAEAVHDGTPLIASGRLRSLGTYLDAFVTARGNADDATVVVGDTDVRLAFGGRLGFRPGSTELLPAGRALVHELQRIASGTPNMMIEVSGYTDDVPIHTREFPSNLELSLARAARVARELERDDPTLAVRTVALGFAEHRALVPNDGPENRARNRRVEVRLVERGESAPAGL